MALMCRRSLSGQRPFFGAPFVGSARPMLLSIPGGPLLTWHDTEPFREAPPEEPAEGEGEEAQAEEA